MLGILFDILTGLIIAFGVLFILSAHGRFWRNRYRLNLSASATYHTTTEDGDMLFLWLRLTDDNIELEINYDDGSEDGFDDGSEDGSDDGFDEFDEMDSDDDWDADPF